MSAGSRRRCGGLGDVAGSLRGHPDVLLCRLMEPVVIGPVWVVLVEEVDPVALSPMLLGSFQPTIGRDEVDCGAMWVRLCSVNEDCRLPPVACGGSSSTPQIPS